MPDLDSQFSTLAASFDGHNARAHSCEYCRKIVITLDYDETLRASSRNVFNVWLGATYNDIMGAQHRGCPFIDQLIPSLGTRLENDREPSILCAHISGETEGRGLQVSRFGFWNSESTKKPGFQGLTLLLLCVPEDSKARERISLRPINEQVLSQKTARLICDWRQECLSLHPECKIIPTGNEIMPTRLIEIRKDGNMWQLRLRTKINSFQPYAALSYCWGGKTSVQTTTSLLEQWSSNIPWNILPQTVQDAVITTHELGIRYLWIDALCIIQDDMNDKLVEVSNMARIYGSADITIAASRSSSVEEGFLHSRAPLEEIYRLPLKLHDQLVGIVDLVPELVRYEPLDRRGWTMQERLLSRRLLEFGTQQTRFTCRRNIKGNRDGWTVVSNIWGADSSRIESLPRELIPGTSNDINDFNNEWSSPETNFSSGRRVLGSEAHENLGGDAILTNTAPPKSIRDHWRDLVGSYSRRSVTVEEDRVLAVAGVVERFAAVIPGQYLAGLWCSNEVLQDLLWESELPLRTRPSQFIAPSWSWMSVKGSVRWTRISIWEDPELTWPWITIVDSKISHPNTASIPFGAIDAASLTIRGHIVKAQWERIPGGRNGTKPREKFRLSYDPNPDVISRLVGYSDADDFEGTEPEWTPVTLLLVIGPRSNRNAPFGPDYSYAICAGLVLEKVSDSSFKRVGLFCYEEYTCCDRGLEARQQDHWSWLYSWFTSNEAATIILV